jgi:5-formyltetrahydrofolate cyclo-ligase
MMAERVEKKEIRKKLIERLLSLTKEEVKRRSKNVEKILSELPIYKEAKVILVYYPLRGEVDVLEMIRKVWSSKRVCFPVMDVGTKDLRAFEVSNLDSDFISGPYGVMQPDITKTKEIALGDIDMILVPGIAFDCQKNRLGRGAGYYDRFLKKIKFPTKKVGVAFEFQVLENLPVHPTFDEKVDTVVTERDVI